MNSSNMSDLVARLSEAYGPSGYEDEVRELIVAEIKKCGGRPEVD
jgi:putative aminopeptidase FrvX